MKRLFAVIISAILLSAAASAQPKAVGLRLGYGAEVSYQHYLGNNFIEADLGLVGSMGYNVTAIYNFNIYSVNGFSFYAGPGAQLGTYPIWVNNVKTAVLNLAVVGQVGAEYTFDRVPLTLSLDWRPAVPILEKGFYWPGFGLGVRYSF